MLIYASSCQRYFLEHGEAFIRSAERHGHQVLVDHVADFPELRPLLKTDISEVIFPCHLRSLRLPELLDQHDEILMLDIDSIINAPIKLGDCDMALFFRLYEKRISHKILLTASYWTKKAKPFALRIRELFMEEPNLQWMASQGVIWRVYEEMGNQFKIKHLDQNFVCYDFDREAPIWTCKGPKRKSNPVYLERRAAC